MNINRNCSPVPALPQTIFYSICEFLDLATLVPNLEYYQFEIHQENYIAFNLASEELCGTTFTSYAERFTRIFSSQFFDFKICVLDNEAVSVSAKFDLATRTLSDLFYLYIQNFPPENLSDKCVHVNRSFQFPFCPLCRPFLQSSRLVFL